MDSCHRFRNVGGSRFVPGVTCTPVARLRSVSFQLLRAVGVLQLRSVCMSTAACCPSSQACSVSAVGRPACGAHVEGLSRNAGQPAQVDNPEQSLDNPRQRRDEYMGLPIEAYEREIATQSRGLVRGRCAWCHGKETWLVDLPLVILVINRLRTPQARRFQAASLEQSWLIMSGREDVARSLANYWRQERMQRPDNVLLAFTGAAVDHELPSAAPGAMQPAQRPPMDAGKLAQDVLALAVPQLCATIQRQFDERFDALAARLQAQRGDNIVNLNVRSPKRPLQQVGLGPPLAVAANDGGPPLPAAIFLDQKERHDPNWAPIRKSFMQTFTNVAMALHKAASTSTRTTASRSITARRIAKRWRRPGA